MTEKTSTTVLSIEGMTCSSCVARVEKSLEKIPGVRASVNLATQSARVDFPDTITAQELIAQVAQIGYQARLPDQEHVHTPSLLKARLIVAIVLTVPIVLISMIPALQFDYWQWVVLVLTLPVVLWSGWPFHRATFMNLRHGTLTMDTLISMGTLAALGWSLYALIFGHAGKIGMQHSFALFSWQTDPSQNIYLEVAAGVTTFILLGRFLEEKSQRQAGAALAALADLTPDTAVVIRDGQEVTVPVAQVKVGEQCVVRPGERIPTDGVIDKGYASINESALTGESVPVRRSVGDAVMGAATVVDGVVTLQATAVGNNTRVAQLAELVEQAQLKKSEIQKLADRISSVFVPIVIVIAVATIIGWVLVGQPLSAGFTAAVAVLVIACPCALGLATPVALMVGTGRAARQGIILSGPAAIEQSANITTVIVDKTGTITTGNMRVVSAEMEGADDKSVLSQVAGVESGSEHPIARAIEDYATESTQPAPAHDFEVTAGGGLSAVVDEHRVFVGSPAFMADNSIVLTDAQHKLINSAYQRGHTVVLAGWSGTVHAVFELADTSKPDSSHAIDRFRALGYAVVLLSGDNEAVARTVASQVGITEVISGASPEDKVRTVAQYQQQGTVVMIGDGINDAAALAQADIGIAMGAGTDLAKAASDMTVISGSLNGAVDAVMIARRTLGIIRGNLFWAFAYNVAAIPLAMVGLLNPMLAGAAMAFSSLFVVLNSLRLKNYSPANI
jgi:Cu+-exporting ATPase